jgi:hypothetical protein
MPSDCSVKHFLFEWDVTALFRATHTQWNQECREGEPMPLFPYFPVIVWMGMIKVMLDVTHDDDAPPINDSINLMTNSASIVPFPTSLAPAVPC